MPLLANPQHETFARELAKLLFAGHEYGLAAEMAYALAFIKTRKWRYNAKKLSCRNYGVSHRAGEAYEQLVQTWRAVHAYPR